MGRDVFLFDECDVSVRLYSVVAFVSLAAVCVYVAGIYAFTSQICHGLMEAADSAEKIDECEFFHICSLFQ